MSRVQTAYLAGFSRIARQRPDGEQADSSIKALIAVSDVD